MNRRGFLSFLGLSPAMYAVDRKSLWASVKGLFRKPMPQCSGWVSTQSLQILKDQMEFANYGNASNHLTGMNSREIFKIGDVVTFSGSYARHPRTHKPTGMLQKFVVTAEGFKPQNL